MQALFESMVRIKLTTKPLIQVGSNQYVRFIKLADFLKDS